MLAGRRYYASGKTEAIVRRKLRRLTTDHAIGHLVAPSRLTTAGHLDDWLEAGRGDWKPRTTEYYETVCRLYLRPAFGSRQLQALSAQEIARQFTVWKESTSLSGGTLLNTYKTLHRALTVGVRWGRVARNVAEGVEPPRARRATPSLWTREELNRFIDGAASTQWEVAWALLLGTGCRLGEALALTWHDIDLDAATVNIERAMSRTAHATIEITPKSLAGTRLLNLPRWALCALAARKQQQREERLAMSHEWRAGSRILGRKDGTPVTPDGLRWAFRQACAAAGVRVVRLHDLRHLHASLLLASGHPLPAVAARLGHASTAVTASVYAHALAGQDTLAAQVIDRVVERATSRTGAKSSASRRVESGPRA